MMEVLMILLILSFSGIFIFVVYINHLNKLIDKLETKIDAAQNLKNIWHDASEEPQDDLELIIYEYKDTFWFTKKQNIIKYRNSWNNFVTNKQMLLWAYVKDLFPKENKK